MTGDRDENREAGFSLTELLVVVFIIGLMSTLVLVSLPQQATSLEREAERLERSLSQAAREAIVRGEPVAWSLTPQGASRFEAYRLGEWIGLGAVHRLEAADMEVSVEHLGLALSHSTPAGTAKRARSGETDSFARSVIFYPAGEATPARIRFRQGFDEIRLDVDAGGHVTRQAQTP